jgi:hypothetical protein
MELPGTVPLWSIPDEGPWYYEQVALAPNYRMTDMQAALIESQLDKLEVFSARRKAIKKRYDEAFSKLPGIIVQQEIPESDTVRHLYIIRLDPDRLNTDRKRFFEAMAAENIVCNVHYIPVYWFPYYEKLGYQRGLCPRGGGKALRGDHHHSFLLRHERRRCGRRDPCRFQNCAVLCPLTGGKRSGTAAEANEKTH